MLNPAIAKKISQLPEGKEFTSYLAAEALRLNNLDDIELNDPTEMAIEVKARKKAYETIVRLLESLVFVEKDVIINNINKEYLV